MQHRGFCVSQSTCKLKNTCPKLQETQWRDDCREGFGELVLVCAAVEKQWQIPEHKTLSKARRGTVKSHEMKQRDRTDQDKEKNELSRLVLIMVCSRERSGQACANATLLDAAKEDMR